jgi:hypothetical protein
MQFFFKKSIDNINYVDHDIELTRKSMTNLAYTPSVQNWYVPNYVMQRPRRTLIPLCDVSTNELANQAICDTIGSNWEYTYHSWTSFILLYAYQIRTEGVV